MVLSKRRSASGVENAMRAESSLGQLAGHANGVILDRIGSRLALPKQLHLATFAFLITSCLLVYIFSFYFSSMDVPGIEAFIDAKADGTRQSL